MVLSHQTYLRAFRDFSLSLVEHWYQNDTTDLTSKFSWWRHQLEKFSALLALCEGNSLVNGESPPPPPPPPQRPVTRNVDVFYLRLNKKLSKPSRRRWFETPSRSLWRHCNLISSRSPHHVIPFGRRNLEKSCCASNIKPRFKKNQWLRVGRVTDSWDGFKQ